MKWSLAVLVVVGAFSVSTGTARAASPYGTPQGNQMPQRIYGGHLMTQQERVEHRAKMRAAKTAAERERIRDEHYQQIRQRAKARGMVLPNRRPGRGRGLGTKNNGRMGIDDAWDQEAP